MPQMFANEDVVVVVPGGLQITRTSAFTRRRNTMTLPISEEKYRRFQHPGPQGLVLIQDFFPTLTPDEREFLLTGATSQEWDDVFPAEEEED